MIYLTMIALNLILGGQPYSLTVERASPELVAVCRLDENCMDLEELSEPEGCAGDLDCCRRFNDCDQY